MIIDSSALVAVLLDEPDAAQLWERLRSTDPNRMSAATYLESGIVIDAQRDPVVATQLDQVLSALEVDIVAVTAAQARVARQAYRDYGKVSGHRAQLNFGDCFSYALAIESNEPLLYKGDDFRHTAVRSAL